jgi:uncharacterized protein YuzE
MRIVLDKESNAVYIYLSNSKQFVTKTYLCNPQEINGMINLDFNQEGKLVGIEIMDALSKLLPEVIQKAEVRNK